VKEEWAGIDITVSTDVSAVYTGKNGSVEVFSAQKGAVLNQRNLMEAEMLRIQKEFQRLTQKDLSTKSGTGAAGGLGGVLWLLGGHIHSGFDIFESLLKLENRFRRANLVITGEGKLDAQTSLGKLPIRVAKLCQKVKVPVVAICGSVIDEKRVLEKEFQGIYPIQTEGIELEEAMQPEFAKQKISEIVQKILKGCV
jgi:glycerate kinase